MMAIASPGCRRLEDSSEGEKREQIERRPGGPNRVDDRKEGDQTEREEKRRGDTKLYGDSIVFQSH